VRLAARGRRRDARVVEPITPEEVRSTMFVILDINDHLRAIRRILEDDDGEAEEDDT
jgi:hypothetical protein